MTFTKKSFIIIDLKNVWNEIEKIGNERHNQKVNYQSNKNIKKGLYNSHVIGVAGEYIYSYLIRKSVDKCLKICGDDGYDFDDLTDVKTTTYWPPILKVPVDTKKWTENYALVYIDEKEKNGCFIGRVSKEVVLKGNKQKLKSFLPLNYMLTIEEVMNYNNMVVEWKP